MTMRVATYAQVNFNTQQNMRLNVEYARTNQQISSGLKSENFGALAADSQRIIQLDSEIARTQTYIDRIIKAEADINNMYDMFGSLIGELDIFMNDLSAAISGGLLKPAELQSAAIAMLDSTTAALNLRIQGRYLFAGSDTANAPVDLTDPLYGSPFAALSAPDFDYYQGNNDVLSVEADEDYVINYGIRANNQAFEQMLRGLDMIINNPADPVTRNTAFTLFEDSVVRLTALQFDVSLDAQKLDSVKNSQEALKVNLENEVSRLREVDVGEAATRLASIETQLEAAYATTGRLLNLSILEYLR